MAPERKTRENQHIFNVGQVGRKTGITLPDNGERDEDGLQPIDGLFSSPEKPVQSKTRGKNANTTISSEESMDVDQSTIPDAVAVLTERKQRSVVRLPPPRSKSPIKTYLKSPARRNPSMGQVSPGRLASAKPSAIASVRRKLDFSNNSFENNHVSPITKSQQAKKASPQVKGASAKLTNGSRLEQQQQQQSESPDGDEEPIEEDHEGDSFQPIDMGDDNDEDVEQIDEPEGAEDESEQERTPEPPPKKGKGKAKVAAAEQRLAAKGLGKRGRPARPKEDDSAIQEEEEEEAEEDGEPPNKRSRRSLENPASNMEIAAKKKPGKASKNNKSSAAAQEPKPKTASKPKTTTKKPKLAPVPEGDSPAIQRGPPMPRNNRGLMILRRETPMEGIGFNKTRSGRNSIKPLAYWKNERVEYSEDEAEDVGGKFVLPRIKGVVRADEVEQPQTRRAPSKSNKGKAKKRAPVEESEDEELEPWEEEPGRFITTVRAWEGEEQLGSEMYEQEQEIALSSAAIITKEIAGASFRFAKTLTLDFFGSGMVDLPPDAIKKPKNSRKMQLVFFVFYGRVEVMVNESVFSIGKGGMWQVPRGNFYSIKNISDKPARIFFAQGCEVLEEPEESQ